MTRSLGFATDVAIRAMEGARIELGATATVVRTATNPRFRWGNFVLAPGVDAGPSTWAAVHRAAFPAADFTTIGIDDGDAVFDEPAWRDAGFTVERLVVLTAENVAASPGRYAIEELRRGEDWRRVLDIEADEAAEEEDAEYSAARLLQRRTSVERCGAVWLGSRVDGLIIATLGVADAGDGVARFQDVQTLRSARRGGHAGALVAAGVRAAAERFGSHRFVIVAEPDGPAIGLYRRLGFEPVETQVQLSRLTR